MDDASPERARGTGRSKWRTERETPITGDDRGSLPPSSRLPRRQYGDGRRRSGYDDYPHWEGRERDVHRRRTSPNGRDRFRRERQHERQQPETQEAEQKQQQQQQQQQQQEQQEEERKEDVQGCAQRLTDMVPLTDQAPDEHARRQRTRGGDGGRRQYGTGGERGRGLGWGDDRVGTQRLQLQGNDEAVGEVRVGGGGSGPGGAVGGGGSVTVRRVWQSQGQRQGQPVDERQLDPLFVPRSSRFFLHDDRLNEKISRRRSFGGSSSFDSGRGPRRGSMWSGNDHSDRWELDDGGDDVDTGNGAIRDGEKIVSETAHWGRDGQGGQPSALDRRDQDRKERRRPSNPSGRWKQDAGENLTGDFEGDQKRSRRKVNEEELDPGRVGKGAAVVVEGDRRGGSNAGNDGGGDVGNRSHGRSFLSAKSRNRENGEESRREKAEEGRRERGEEGRRENGEGKRDCEAADRSGGGGGGRDVLLEGESSGKKGGRARSFLALREDRGGMEEEDPRDRHGVWRDRGKEEEHKERRTKRGREGRDHGLRHEGEEVEELGNGGHRHRSDSIKKARRSGHGLGVSRWGVDEEEEEARHNKKSSRFERRGSRSGSERGGSAHREGEEEFLAGDLSGEGEGDKWAHDKFLEVAVAATPPPAPADDYVSQIEELLAK